MPNKFVCDQLGSLVGLEEGVCIVGVEDWLAVAVQLIVDSGRPKLQHFLIVPVLVLLIVLSQ